MHIDNVIEDIHKHDQRLRTNHDRFRASEFAMNEAQATVFLCIGLHFDKATQRAYPVITGSQWIDRDQALQILQEAIAALDIEKVKEQQKLLNNDGQAKDQGIRADRL